MIGLSAVMICVGILFSNIGNPYYKSGYAYEPYIARIVVEGTISSEGNEDYDHQYLLTTLDQLAADRKNRGLIVCLDTPGGELLASAELADKIVEYKELTGNPVYVYGHNMMASGGYWIACAGDWIVLNQYGITGSIGVTYGTMIDISGFLENNGVKAYTITSGTQKSMGSIFEPMSEETNAIFQGIIDEYYTIFIDWIISQRDIERGQLIDLADGRIYTASQAEQNQLIDQIGTYKDTIRAIDKQLGNQYPIYDYLPPTEYSVWQDLSLFDYLLQGKGDSDLLMEMLPPSGPLVYYQENNIRIFV